MMIMPFITYIIANTIKQTRYTISMGILYSGSIFMGMLGD